MSSNAWETFCHSDMASFLYLLLVGFISALSFTIFKKSRNNLTDSSSSLRGPTSRSWLYGNMVEFMLEIPGGKTASSWFKKYGTTLKVHACFGEGRIITADPASIKYILSNPTVFGKTPAHQFINLVLFGSGGLLYAQGEDHHRVRAISNSMFSPSAVRRLVPTLQNIAKNLSAVLSAQTDSVVDVYSVIHSTTLRSITEAVGYKTTDLDPYTLAYGNLVLEIAQRSKTALLSGAILASLPTWLIAFIKDHPPAMLKKFFHHRVMARAVSAQLLQLKREKEKLGEEGDVNLFNAIVNANDKAINGMTDDELHDQFGSLVIAGEDTTANTLLWVLYALAISPKWQELVRQEIGEASSDKSSGELEYDKLPVLNSVIKETLRFYATIPLTERIANSDTIIPLSDAVTTDTGNCLTQLKIKKGQTIVISIRDYNRLQSIWGDDADEFNPSRWLNKSDTVKAASIGPYSNLLTFLGGPRVCLGWRFAILELQVLTSEIVKSFTFSLPKHVTIQPATAISLVPIDSQGHTSLPLEIRVLE